MSDYTEKNSNLIPKIDIPCFAWNSQAEQGLLFFKAKSLQYSLLLCIGAGILPKKSKGMINNLCRSFAQKTESQRKEIFCDMLLSPVMHTDCTNARVNGESSYVFVCAVPDGGVLYFARGKKGHDGIKGTVVEDYQGNTGPRS